MKAFFYLPLDFGFAGTDQDDDLPDAVAVEEVIYDLESSGIPVEDDEVIRHYELVIAGIGIFDEAGNVVRDVTDNGACEGDHADDDYDEADDRDRGILRSDIFDDIGDAACIKDHAYRVEGGFEEPQFLSPCQRHLAYDERRKEEEDDIKEEYREKDYLSRIFSKSDAEPFADLSVHSCHLAPLKSICIL